MYQSPMNYTGGKYKLLPQLLPHFPDDIGTFVDLFCGGCNVGINVPAKTHIYNDHCAPLIDLYRTMKSKEKEEFLEDISEVIDRYGLSRSSVYGYDHYGCESSTGLGKYNRSSYLRLRTDFNTSRLRNDHYYVMFYVLIVYAFNNQIRFNSSGEFNLPVGKRDFNRKMENKFRGYVTVIQEQSAQFRTSDFRRLDLSGLREGDFVYADPPYLITCAAYNEQGGWTEKEERDLYRVLDGLHEKGVRFALSNVMDAKGKKNTLLYDWTEKNKGYRIIDLDHSYKNANYQRKEKNSGTREVLIVNYP